MRTLVLLGMLIPLVGLGALAASLVQERRQDREVSAALAHEAAALRDAVDFRAAVAGEQVRSTVLGIAHDFDVPAEELLTVFDRGQLEEARRRVDALREQEATPVVGLSLDELGELRDRLDAGVAGRAEVDALFERFNRRLERQWTIRLHAIEQAADRQAIDADLRRRLETLRESEEALAAADDRISAGLAVLLSPTGPEAMASLIEADTAFDAATSRARPAPGTGAAEAWHSFRTDPAAERTESILAFARAVTVGSAAPWSQIDPALLAAGLEDGVRWGTLLTDTVDAAAGDLEAAAAARSDRDATAATGAVAGAFLLVVISLAVALATARHIVVPARQLEDAARRIGDGEFVLPPLAVRGPREIGATVRAFNDMAATLTAVEEHAVALALDPTLPVLDAPLPGRTGRAMQAAIDRLRTSMTAAEAHRSALIELANRDGLTGLLNREAAFTAIERDLARARRDGTSVLALFVDLDGLKPLNDTCGHHVGDEAIRATATALAATTRDADIVARLGGDEFMVVGPVPEGGAHAVHAFAERVRAAVSLQTVDVVDDDGIGVRAMPLRCSIGVAVSDPLTESAERLVRDADAAMYRAKQTGRDRVAWSERLHPAQPS